MTREQLIEALKEARDMVYSWSGYASAYFQEKHNLSGDLAQLDEWIRSAEQQTAVQSDNSRDIHNG